jgi:hypothetical protein
MMNIPGFGGFGGGFMPTTPSMFGQSHMTPYQQQSNNNMTASITNQKPKKVIYVDLNGNQKVFTAREDGQGYYEDQDDERNRNATAVKPILDVENYDGFNYHPAPESEN